MRLKELNAKRPASWDMVTGAHCTCPGVTPQPGAALPRQALSGSRLDLQARLGVLLKNKKGVGGHASVTWLALTLNWSRNVTPEFQ